MRAEEDSTANGEDKVEIVGSKVKLRRCLKKEIVTADLSDVT